MANYSAIKAAVNAYIKENGRKEITGRILNAVLTATIDSLGKFFQFAGVATPSTDPEEPDQNVCYLAGEPGTYVHFDNITLENEEIALLFYDGTWSKQRMLLGIQEVSASVDANVGTPSVDVSYSEGSLVLTFHNLKGEQGNTGAAAGFGTVGATVDDNIGTPGVSVQTSGPDTAKNLMFTFTNLKGETGVTSVVATVDNTSGNPSCAVSLVNGVLTLAFTGLKGLKGDTGVSADYPITIYNGLDSDATDQALSAAQGKVLQGEISQLEAKVDNFVDEVQVQSPNIFNKNDVVDNKAIDYRDGTSFSASGYCYTGRIAIPSDADSIYINKATNSGIRGWACYNANAVYTHGANNTRLITVQPGDAFFRFTLSMSDKDTCMAVVGDSTALPPEYMPYGTITSYKAKDDIIPFDSLVFKTIETGKNRLNPAEVVNDKYIDNQDGRAYSYSAEDPVSITGYIPVSKDGLYFNRYVRFGTAIGAAVYDANKTYIRACYQNYYYQEGDAYVRYTFRTQYLSDAQVEPGNVGTEYEAYTEREVIDPAYIPTPQIDGESGTIKIFLPATIYAVVGDTLQIFYQSLVRSVNVSNYDVRISCSKGKQYHRYFEYTPSSGDVGTNTFRVTVVDDYGNTLGTALCNLVTVASGTSPASAKNVVCVGSSTTANGKWPAECFRRLTGSGGSPSGDGKSNIVFCGNQTKDGAGFVGNSGWGWVDYATSGRPAFRFTIGTTPNVALGNVYSNNGHSYTVIEISDNGTILCSTSSASNTPQASGTLTKTSGSGDATVAFSASAQDSQNPFWDYTNNKLTFVPFANSYCGGTIDAMYIWLGANGLTNWQTNFATFRGYMETFADTLHTEFPSAKLYLVQGTIPSMKVMMPGYGADGSGYADTFGMVDSFFNLRAFYQEFADDSDYSGFVEYVDGASQFDSDYNFPLTQKAVNTRNNTVTEPYANNTVHPGDPGYMQVADAVYRHFVAKFCQS